MTSTTTDIRKAFAERRKELQSELQRLDRAEAELNGSPDFTAAQRARTRRSATPPKRRKRASRGSNQDAILNAVRIQPQIDAKAISGMTGISMPVVYSALSRMAAKGVLVKYNQDDGRVTYTVSS
jgi:sugar-specific transcriptional regulator TrmB